MDKTKNKNIKRVIALVLVVLLISVATAIPFLLKSNTEADGSAASILSGTVNVETINSEVIGGGTLYSENETVISVPTSVKLTEFLVNNGDYVNEGDAVAKVDRVTVMLAISEVQSTLNDLSKEIKTESSASTTEKITAEAGGNVKAVYASAGDNVQDVMLAYGSLAVLSLDGNMAVKLVVDSDLKAGDEVYVAWETQKVTGKVDSNLLGELVIKIEDDDYPIDQEVTVSTIDDVVLGAGSLYIYNPWNIVAYDGVVDEVKIKEGTSVSAGKTVITIKETGTSAYYKQLINQRHKYEDLMFDLFKMYQTETIYASTDGMVTGIDEKSVQLLSYTSGIKSEIVMLSNAPNGNDEISYVNRIAKVTAKGQNGWGLTVDPTDVEITDYKNLSAVVVDQNNMNEISTFNPYSSEYPTPVYELKDGEWATVELDKISIGDVLLFAGDSEGNVIWIVRMESAKPQVTPDDQNGSGNTGNTGNNDGPSQGNNNGKPTYNSSDFLKDKYGVPSSSSRGNTTTSNSGSTSNAEVTLDLYSLDVADIMTITPQEEIYLDISVNELDVNKLKVGMKAEVKINAYSTEKFLGVISDISNQGTNNGGYSFYTVKLTVAKEENMLAGMNATATIVVSTESEVLSIPVEALAENGHTTVVYTGYDEANKELINPVVVTVGVSDGNLVEIKDGLTAGQKYYYEYYDTLVTNNQSGSSFNFSFNRRIFF